MLFAAVCSSRGQGLQTSLMLWGAVLTSGVFELHILVKCRHPDISLRMVFTRQCSLMFSVTGNGFLHRQTVSKKKNEASYEFSGPLDIFDQPVV